MAHLSTAPAVSRTWVPALLLVFGLSGACRPKGHEENGRIVAPKLVSLSIQRILLEQDCKGDRCRSQVELAARDGRWYLGREFPADSAKVAALVRNWRRLVSDKVLVGTDAKHRAQLGLGRPCLKATWWSEKGRELEIRVSCPNKKETLALWDGKGPVHLASVPLKTLGARERSWFLGRKVMTTRPSDLSGIRIERSGAKPIVLARKGSWKLLVGQWKMPADEVAVGALVEALDSLSWKSLELGKGSGSGSVQTRVELFVAPNAFSSQSESAARPREVLELGTCQGSAMRVTRKKPYPASGCLAGSNIALPSSLDLLDKSLLVLAPSDVTSFHWSGDAVRVSRRRGAWKLVRADMERDGDAEAVAEYLKALRETKAIGVQAASEKDGQGKSCLFFESGNREDRVCLLGRDGDFVLVRRGVEPLVFKYPKKIEALFHPEAMQFFSRLAVALPLKLVAGFRITRGRYREVVVSRENGDWFLREPMETLADPVAASGLARALSRLVVRRYRRVRSFSPILSIDLVVPEVPAQPIEGLLPFLKYLLKMVLPGLAGFPLEVGSTGKGCNASVWALTFDLDRETCLALTRSLVPRRLLPGLRPDLAIAMKLCGKKGCRKFRLDKGRCLPKDGGPVRQDACRVRLSDAVGLTADRILGFEPAPRSVKEKICLSLVTAAGSGVVAKDRHLGRVCLLFGPTLHNGLRALWVQGRPVVYGVNPALADRLVHEIPAK